MAENSYRAIITETYYSTTNDRHIERGEIIPARDISVYIRRGTKGTYYPGEGLFVADNGTEYYPPEEAVRRL